MHLSIEPYSTRYCRLCILLDKKELSKCQLCTSSMAWHQLQISGVHLACSQASPQPTPAVAGGTSIEELAEKFPEKIVKVPVDVRKGVTEAQARQMVDGLGVTGDKAQAAKQIMGLYDLFTQKDCTMVEVRFTSAYTGGLDMPVNRNKV